MEITSEGQLRQILERQRCIIDNIPALVAYWDSDQRCRFANKPYFEWFGFTPESLYGVSLRELLGDALYEKNKPYIVGALSGVHQEFERDLVRKLQGDIRHTQASYIPDIVDGQVLGFFVLVTDITERKKAEHTAIQAREEALKAYQFKTQFLANLSHEIRTPLSGVIGMLGFALGTQLSGMQREFLDAANQSAEHLLSIINDILDLSKIEAEEMFLSNEVIHVRTTITSALAATQIQAKQKGLSTQIIIDSRVPEYVMGDSIRLRQVLLNVFGNAVKFTTSGKVELRVFMREDGLIHFEVTDTGIGISEDNLETLFVPFRQVDDSRSRTYGGTGLGLAICKKLVRMMGGEIRAQSAFGKGSVFHFSVRMKEVFVRESNESMANETPVSAAPKELHPKLRVLMAEDDPVCVRVQTLMLQAQNCEVVHAENGQEAVELARTQNFNFILLDLQMPVLDGLETSKRIRSDESSLSRNTPIIALTTNAFTEDRVACFDAGMNMFLNKPLRLVHLAEITELYRGPRASHAGRSPS